MKTVLVVDDSRIMRNVLKNTFDELKIACQYLEAENGKKALEILEKNEVSIVFLDWNMPEMDGMEFLKEVKSMPSYQNLPVVMVTSEAAKYNVVEALQNGAADYITKPVSVSAFKEKISEIDF